MRFNPTVEEIQLSGIRKIFEMANSKAINLGLGEPDFHPPDRVKEALKEAVDKGYNKYDSTYGLKILREAIAEKYSKYDDLTADNVLITVGATEGIFSTMLSVVERGSKILIPDPGFVLYEPHTKIAGGVPLRYQLRSEKDFQPDEEEIKNLIDDKVKAIVVNSPSNPTGSVLSPDSVKFFLDIAEDYNLTIISDEVYMNFVYDSQHQTFLGKGENVIFVQSFSKEFAMTGWRIGYLIGDKKAIKTIGKIHYYLVACPTTPIEYAAYIAIRDCEEFTVKMVKEFSKRRKVIYEELKKIDGIHPNVPKGAFYIFPKYDYNIKSEKLAEELAKRGLLSAPGSAFGPGGEGHIRFSYAASIDDIRKGMEILRNYVEEIS